MEPSQYSLRGRQHQRMMTQGNENSWYGRAYRAPQGLQTTGGHNDFGTYFGYQRGCRAAGVQCFNCKGFGHFSKDCSSKRSVNSTSQPERKVPKRKSERKRNRDRTRALHFYKRKSTCVEMPFYELSESELYDFFPKPGRLDNAEHTKLKHHYHQATQIICALKADYLIQESSIAKLQSCLAEEQIRLRKTEHETCLEANKTVKLTQELENQKRRYECLQQTNQDFEIEIDELQGRSEFYLKSIQILERDVKQKKTEMEDKDNKMRDLELKLKSVETSYRNSKEQLEAEEKETNRLNKMLSKCRCLSMALRPSSPPPAEKCTRCGLRDGHYPHDMEDCPAFDELCNFCGNLGHFARECRAKTKSARKNCGKRRPVPYR